MILKIYNLQAQEIATLVDEMKEAGCHSVTWDASEMASGIYVCRFQAGGFSRVRKMIFIR